MFFLHLRSVHCKDNNIKITDEYHADINISVYVTFQNKL